MTWAILLTGACDLDHFRPDLGKNEFLNISTKIYKLKFEIFTICRPHLDQNNK